MKICLTMTVEDQYIVDVPDDTPVDELACLGGDWVGRMEYIGESSFEITHIENLDTHEILLAV